jgi:hypothetical protein
LDPQLSQRHPQSIGEAIAPDVAAVTVDTGKRIAH